MWNAIILSGMMYTGVIYNSFTSSKDQLHF